MFYLPQVQCAWQVVYPKVIPGPRFIGSFQPAAGGQEIPQRRHTLFLPTSIHTALPLMSIGRNSVTWPHLNANEPSKSGLLCIQEEKEMGFIEHVAISASEFVPCGSRIAQ